MKQTSPFAFECEVCGSVYSPMELKNPYSTLSGAAPVLKSSEHYFFKLSDARCIEFLRGWIETDATGKQAVQRFEREGSGILTSMTTATGLVEIAEEVTAVAPGDLIDFLPFSDLR